MTVFSCFKLEATYLEGKLAMLDASYHVLWQQTASDLNQYYSQFFRKKVKNLEEGRTLLIFYLALDLALLTAKCSPENSQRKLYLTHTSFVIPLGSRGTWRGQMPSGYVRNK